MGIMSAWIFGILGGLCAVMGIVNATAVVPELAGLTWMFWLMLSGILLLASIAFTIGGALGPWLTGFLFDRTASYQMAFLVCATLSTLALILTFFLKVTEKQGVRP